MKIDQKLALSPELLQQSVRLGEAIARLRLARNLTQVEAALRAGISRSSGHRLEQGDPGLSIGQILRYVDAIAPGMTLEVLLSGQDPSLAALAATERRQRVRRMTTKARDDMNF